MNSQPLFQKWFISWSSGVINIAKIINIGTMMNKTTFQDLITLKRNYN